MLLKRTSYFALTTAIAVTVLGAQLTTTSTPFVVRESITSAPPNFTKVVDISLIGRNVTLRIQLAQNNIMGLEGALYDASTPVSENYGQYLSLAEVASYVAPTEETTSLVNEWLQSNALEGEPISNAGDWIRVSMPVALANQMLDTEFSIYEDATGIQFIRTLSYSIPSNLERHINLIHPTVNFPINPAPRRKHDTPDHRRRTMRTTAPSSCEDADAGITPACLQDLYSIPTHPANSCRNSLWVSGFVGEYADQSDINTFIAEYRPDIPPSVNTTVAVVEINGGSNSQNPQDAGSEAILDLEYTVGLATGVPVTFLSVGPNQQGGISDTDFLQAVLAQADYLVGLDTPPYVLTTSYGVDETQLTSALAIAICNAYMQLSARGASVIYASGDGGVGGSSAFGECTDGFVPAFPATCPYVTSVGSTEIISGNLEEAALWSSGGFSNIFAQPPYQASAVSGYLSYLGSTYSGLYNATGRGFPDVSTNGLFFQLVYRGESTNVFGSGTSASSPTFASVIALINDRLLSVGKGPLGFLNPFLYANPNGFTDIISGSNPGCGYSGFNATLGWDPISGLGTPNFIALAAAAAGVWSVHYINPLCFEYPAPSV